MPTVLIHPTAHAATTDDALVRRVRAGDDDAVTLIVQRHEAALTGYARQLLGGAHHDAEECVQDAFVKALGFLRTRGERDIALRPWLYAIVRNACLDRLRKGRRTVPLDDPGVTLAAPSGDPFATCQGREQLRVVIGGLRDLPARQRAALVMRELEGRPHEELAATLGVSVAASKALVCRARQGLAHLRPVA